MKAHRCKGKGCVGFTTQDKTSIMRNTVIVLSRLSCFHNRRKHLSCVRNVSKPPLFGLIITLQVLPLQEFQSCSQFCWITDVEAVVCCKHQYKGIAKIWNTAIHDGLVHCHHEVSSCQGRTPYGTQQRETLQTFKVKRKV